MSIIIPARRATIGNLQILFINLFSEQLFKASLQCELVPKIYSANIQLL